MTAILTCQLAQGSKRGDSTGLASASIDRTGDAAAGGFPRPTGLESPRCSRRGERVRDRRRRATMMRSTDRILTTHVGSLPRPADLLAMLRARERGQPQDAQAFAARVRGAVTDVVRKQLELGVDIVDDGEMGKPGFIHYANERLAGSEPLNEAVGSPWKNSREVKAFPEFYEWFGRVMPSPAATAGHMVCTGPISYRGHAHVQADIANLKAALGARRATDAFMPAISPTSVEDWQRNRYYKTQEEVLFAIADAMREEYKAIVDAGFIVQIDDPHIATYYVIR